MAQGNGPPSLDLWRALLDFATRVGSDDLVNQTPSTFTMMSEQDQQFLTNAMAQVMKDNDPVRQLKTNLEILSKLEYGSPNDEQKSRGIAALERIIDLCGSLDVAADFHKLGGFRILVPSLASRAAEFRAHGAELIGELAQNNPYCQNELKKVNILGVLLQLIDSDPDPVVRTKALFAISCLIRNNEELETEFVNSDGISYLARAASSDYERLSMKAAFLLSTLLKNQENKEKAMEIGLISQLASMISRPSQGLAGEQTTAALLALVEDCPKAVEACQKPELGLKRLLEDQLKDIGSNEAFEDERENIEKLLKTCWPTG